ncbi:hypothetical protein BSZ36_18610 [Rubricoccus marinus]|uniref:Uncharacterized protein n=1 Tax=Rubricoccus marinus TaxID=716817 RepID=A0A259TTT4_9BACT|nr:hypothetical protein BSZ36_18610 [Rubricoccus marinus]
MWKVVDRVYESERFPVERAAQELWRAATSQPSGDIAAGLASDVVAACLDVALNAGSRSEASASAGLAVAFSGEASLAADIARRAAVRSVGAEGDRALGFARALFSEASNYLVSRDLPGFVGPSGRAQTVGQAVELKAAVRSRVEAVVEEGPRPPTGAGPEWSGYVRAIVQRLAGR